MFGWIKNLFGYGPPRDILIFRYWDGTSHRSADPVEVERVLIRHLGDDWYNAVKKLSAPIPAGVIGIQEEELKSKREEQKQRILTAVDEAFGVHRHQDGRGLTEMYRIALLDGFVKFCLDLMELSRPFESAQSRASPSPAG